MNADTHISLSLDESHLTLEWHRNSRNNSLQKENHVSNGMRHPLPFSAPQRLPGTPFQLRGNNLAWCIWALCPD